MLYFIYQIMLSHRGPVRVPARFLLYLHRDKKADAIWYTVPNSFRNVFVSVLREVCELFTVYSDNDRGSTLISNLFIDKYMRDANDAQLKVYLYLLRMMNAGKTTSIPDMADQFNHTERDVIRSLRYWERRGLIELEYSAAGELMSLRMLSPRPDSDRQAYPVPFRGGARYDSDREDEDEREEESPRPAPAVPRLQAMAIPSQHSVPGQSGSPQYPAPGQSAGSTQYPASGQSAGSPQYPASGQSAGSPQLSSSGQSAGSPQHPDAASVEAFRSSAKRAQLLFVIEQYIGKPLSPSEVEAVYYISEQLHFSDALIDYLLQYCIDRGKKDFRYIQKVAVNWAEHGITTPKQAERAVSNFGRNRRGASGVKSSANPFNQFEQNQYDFDELEKEILGN